MSDAEAPSVYSCKTPVARVQHECCECDAPILPGDPYERFAGCWDGKWSTYKTCVPCVDLRKELRRRLEDDEDMPPFGQLRLALSGGDE